MSAPTMMLCIKLCISWHGRRRVSREQFVDNHGRALRAPTKSNRHKSVIVGAAIGRPLLQICQHDMKHGRKCIFGEVFDDAKDKNFGDNRASYQRY